MKHLYRETIELSEAESEHQSVGELAQWSIVSLGEESLATSHRKEHTSQRIVPFCSNEPCDTRSAGCMK